MTTHTHTLDVTAHTHYDKISMLTPDQTMVSTCMHHTSPHGNLTTAVNVTCPRCGISDFMFYSCATRHCCIVHHLDSPFSPSKSVNAATARELLFS